MTNSEILWLALELKRMDQSRTICNCVNEIREAINLIKKDRQEEIQRGDIIAGKE